MPEEQPIRGGELERAMAQLSREVAGHTRGIHARFDAVEQTQREHAERLAVVEVRICEHVGQTKKAVAAADDAVERADGLQRVVTRRAAYWATAIAGALVALGELATRLLEWLNTN